MTADSETKEPWLRGLNDQQKAAAVHEGGPLLILAGAGSGKTRVIVHRIAHLILGRGVEPWRILAVTFTNKAAEEMQKRVAELLGAEAAPVWVSTFHSLGARLLRRHIHLLDRPTTFAIYDETDQLSLIKQVMREAGLDPKAEDPKSFRAWVDAVKREDKTEEQLEKSPRPRDKKWLPLFRAYQERLRSANAVDFGDLLLLTHRLFSRFPDLREEYRRRFRHLLVDEYQDTNRLQYLLIRDLADDRTDLCVVGDEDQSIYGWRGADIRNILDFERDYPNTRLVLLEQNYRSTSTIISAASRVIGHNRKRKEKRLWTANPEGERLRLHLAADGREEAAWVVEEVLRLKGSGRLLSEIAVFYRTHAQSRLFEEALREREIPHAVYGGPRFYDRKEIKDILAYLKFMDNPADEVSFFRIVNLPPRGVGPTTLEILVGTRKRRGGDWSEAISASLEEGTVGGRAAEGLRAFQALLQELTPLAATSLSRLVEQVIEKSGYRAMLQKEKSIESISRQENLDELITAAGEHMAHAEDPTLRGFLEKVALVTNVDRFDPAAGQLTLMTLHSAKGLEFPVVFVVGLEEGIFPHARSLQGEEKDEVESSELEEERRLFYVGMTRARELLYLTAAFSRNLRGYEEAAHLSRFLREIPEELVEKIGRRGRALSRPARKAEKAKRKQEPQREDFGDSELVYEEGERKGIFANGGVFRPGDRVLHPTYGEGVVQRFEGSGPRTKVIIRFPNGSKKFFAALTHLTPVE